MGSSLSVGIGSFAVFYHTPSIFGLMLLTLVVAGGWGVGGLRWWELLVQAAVGTVLARALHTCMPSADASDQGISIAAIPATNPRFLLHWVSSIFASLCYGYLYYLYMPTARLVDPRHVFLPWIGPPTAVALSLAVDAVMHISRRSFITRRSYTPQLRPQVYSFACISAAILDLIIHAEHWTTYLLPILPLLLCLQLFIAEKR